MGQRSQIAAPSVPIGKEAPEASYNRTVRFLFCSSYSSMFFTRRKGEKMLARKITDINRVLVLLLGLALLASVSMSVAQAQTSNTVIEGNARFTVLSPTLIRMEYAADGAFDNGTTFNVVNRSFPVPSYTTQVVSGWREIQTSNLLVRYQQGSGAFNATNVTVRLTVNGQTVTAAPFTGCLFGHLC